MNLKEAYEVSDRKLFKGNEAVGEAAIRAGCRYFFGYPITPQNEIPEYMSRRLPEVGGCFLQAESEVAAINMVYGAAAAGAMVMTSSSSPGISLKQEGISYIAGSLLSPLIVNMVRGGPGLGDIQPAQSDYFQAVKGGGHGDYRLIVFAPASIQEMVDLVYISFETGAKYQMPVMILADGVLGQMMEAVEFPEMKEPWGYDAMPFALNGASGRPPRVIKAFDLDPEKMYKLNFELQDRWKKAEENETRVEMYKMEDAEFALVAYGTSSRICRSAVDKARSDGVKLGLIRPITVWPFPYKAIHDAADNVKGFLTVEMSLGQFVEDVRLAVNGKIPVGLHAVPGGLIPKRDEILKTALALLNGKEA
jgi:2-oxoglutarate ferredoxin oxidoreductase subunit alpha